jgi:hypothetical protein
MSWINWAALGKILGVGLLAGAGLPALFAVGLRFISPRGEDEIVLSGDTATVKPAREIAPSPVLIAAGSLCFAVVLAAIGWGIYIIVNGA